MDASKSVEASPLEVSLLEASPLQVGLADAAAVEDGGVAAAGLLAAVADPVRWRLLSQLTDGTPTCVCDLRPVAAVAPNLLSYHLKVLREAGLVHAHRRGRWVDYTIAADALARLRDALPGTRDAGSADRVGGSR